ncbi:hypothetical protein E2562_021325 [Oryza meyeriana var. granulata]|uniref:Uncharacterized protein n=1 Tax=Oryza meyeriana var. granulata TaxID=110450 RepID=A0A6G1BZE3_9ORYZ|nr:hypothetical protein E2562_021325 [Oryza meyeriana var. granulata]
MVVNLDIGPRLPPVMPVATTTGDLETADSTGDTGAEDDDKATASDSSSSSHSRGMSPSTLGRSWQNWGI